jgi:hypothetical protein
MYHLIAKILEKYEIFMHQLRPNAIVRLGTFIWVVRSQGGCTEADAFCRIHDMHYQTKARVDKLHKNFGCYNFIYRKDVIAPVLAYGPNGMGIGQKNGFMQKWIPKLKKNLKAC